MNYVQIITKEDKKITSQHFNNYLKELSMFDPTIKFDELGNPIYKWFDCYFEDKDRYPFLLNANGNFAGLALIRDLGNKNFEIAEFYVLPQFRKNNNSLNFAMSVVNMFDGNFTFSTRIENERAIKFWDKFASKYTLSSSKLNGYYKEWQISNLKLKI